MQSSETVRLAELLVEAARRTPPEVSHLHAAR